MKCIGESEKPFQVGLEPAEMALLRGAEETQTLCLIAASDALSQVSYDPVVSFYDFGKSTTPDQLDQPWVNCLNLFDAEYTV